MQVAREGQHYVLTLYPTTQGMAYMLFEGPLALVDWGKSGATGRAKNERCIQVAKNLIERYVPDVLILEDTSKLASRRSARIRMLNRSLAATGSAYGVTVRKISKAEVRRMFADHDATTKHERARVVAAMLPAISHRLPPKRKPWMSEDPRLSIFEAASLGLAFYSAKPRDESETSS